jgi:hypothetical protein
MQHVYLVSFDGGVDLDADSERRLMFKDWLGRAAGSAGGAAHVAIDRLEPTEAHVKALLPPTERGVRVTPTVTESGMLMFDEEPA